MATTRLEYLIGEFCAEAVSACELHELATLAIAEINRLLAERDNIDEVLRNALLEIEHDAAINGTTMELAETAARQLIREWEDSDG